MKEPRKQYTRKFKMRAIRLLETSGKSARQLDQELGIGAGSLWRRKRALQQTARTPFPAMAVSPPSRSICGNWSARTRSCARSGTSYKRYCHLLRTKAVRFEFIDDHREMFSVTRQCKALFVSPSGYYACRKPSVSAREMANQELVRKIGAVYHDRYETHGSPGVYRELKAHSVACSENRVARLMRLRSLRAKQVRR